MYGSYSKLMLKLFLAEAVLTNHSALVASADVDPQQLTKVYIEISTLISVVYNCELWQVHYAHGVMVDIPLDNSKHCTITLLV